MERATIIIHGHIQASGLKYAVHTIILSLRIRGYVRHVDDQTAEIVVEGAKPDIESLVGQVRGIEEPSGVESVSISYQEATGEFKSFRIIPEDRPVKEVVEGFAALHAAFEASNKSWNRMLAKRD